jgi:hypothetical protein
MADRVGDAATSSSPATGPIRSHPSPASADALLALFTLPNTRQGNHCLGNKFMGASRSKRENPTTIRRNRPSPERRLSTTNEEQE